MGGRQHMWPNIQSREKEGIEPLGFKRQLEREHVGGKALILRMQVTHSSNVFFCKKTIIPQSIIRIKSLSEIALQNLPEKRPSRLWYVTENKFLGKHKSIVILRNESRITLHKVSFNFRCKMLDPLAGLRIPNVLGFLRLLFG